MKIKKSLLVLAVVLILSTFIYLSNRKTSNIPYGIYSRLDDSGSILNEGTEAAWVITKKSAENRYLVFSIQDIGDEIYFEIEYNSDSNYGDDAATLYRYEVSYDNKTKILTVNMPLDGDNPSVIPIESERRVFKFKKTGFVLGWK